MEALQLAAADVNNIVLEIGPHPTLATAIAQSLVAKHPDMTTLASMVRGEDTHTTMLDALGALYTLGHPLDHHTRHPAGGHCAQLPTYAWSRKRHWAAGARLEVASDERNAHVSSRIGGYALVARTLNSARPKGDRHCETDIHPERFAYLADHCVSGASLLPAAVLLDMAMAAGPRTSGQMPEIHDFAVSDQVALPPDGALSLQFLLTPQEGGSPFELFARCEEKWRLQATGVMSTPPTPITVVDDLSPLRDRLAPVEHCESFYDQLARSGIAMGERFRAIDRLWTGDHEALAHLRLPESVADRAGGHVIHPVLLQSALALLTATAPPRHWSSPPLPARFARLTVHRHTGAAVWAHASCSSNEHGELVGEVRLLEDSGQLVAQASEVHILPVARASLRRALRDSLDDLVYEIKWRPSETPHEGALLPHPDGPGTWIVLTDDERAGRALTARLESLGEHCLLVRSSHDYAVAGQQRTLDPAQPEHTARLLAQTRSGDIPDLRAVVHLWSAAPASTAQIELDTIGSATDMTCGALLHLVHELAAGQENTAPARVWVITRGAQPAPTDGAPVSPLHAPLWGLARVVALEHPELWGGLIDLDPSVADDPDVLLRELWRPDGEDQIAYRRRKRMVARLARSAPVTHAGELHLDADASYLVTGGRGALGLKIARWLADQGARSIILSGRTALPDRNTWHTLPADAASTPAAIREIESLGAVVHTPQADVADPHDMAALLRPSATWPPLRGIVHAAGVFQLCAVRDMQLDNLRAVLRPKVQGTWILHELSRDRDLDFFILFSSAASVWGSALAAHYTAANHFEDAIAHYRRRLGLPAIAVNWGWWSGSDMVTTEAQSYFASIGLNVLDDELAFAALEQLLLSGHIQRTVAPVEWSRFKPTYEAKRRRPLLELLEVAQANRVHATSNETLELIERLRATPAPARRALVVSFLEPDVAEVMGADATRHIDPRLGFFEAGMDSVMSVELITRLETRLGIPMRTTAAFEHPTVDDLARHILEDVLDLADPQPHAGTPAQASNDPPGAGDAADLSEDDLFEMLAGELDGGPSR